MRACEANSIEMTSTCDLGVSASPIRVTIVIVTYRSTRELPACLASILASDVKTKIVLIDNDSGDGTLELAKEYEAHYESIVVLSSKSNLGLAAANNLALPYLEGDYVLILNPDTELAPRALSLLLSKMDRESDLGVIGPKCVYEDGSAHTSYHYGWGFFHLFVWRVFPYSVVRKLYDQFALYRERNVAFVSGACLLTRTPLFRQINGYDPTYFLTVEDAVDLCERIRARGYQIKFTPQAVVTHLCGRSGILVPFLTTMEGYKGDIYHFRKHRGPIGGAMAFAIVAFACCAKLAANATKALIFRRRSSLQNFHVYKQILPRLLVLGPKIAFGAKHAE